MTIFSKIFNSPPAQCLVKTCCLCLLQTNPEDMPITRNIFCLYWETKRKKVSLFLSNPYSSKGILSPELALTFYVLNLLLNTRLKSIAITCSWWQNTFKFSHIFAAECLPIWTQHEISGMWEQLIEWLQCFPTAIYSGIFFQKEKTDIRYKDELCVSKRWKCF